MEQTTLQDTMRRTHIKHTADIQHQRQVTDKEDKHKKTFNRNLE